MTPPVRKFKIPESVLVVIHSSNLEVLLLERADRPGFWQSVTGSKDHRREATRQTAIREVEEETGIRIGSIAVSGYRVVRLATNDDIRDLRALAPSLRAWC